MNAESSLGRSQAAKEFFELTFADLFVCGVGIEVNEFALLHEIINAAIKDFSKPIKPEKLFAGSFVSHELLVLLLCQTFSSSIIVLANE